MNLSYILEQYQNNEFYITQHAQEQMLKRNITFLDIENLFRYGTILERYPDAKPNPKCLITGKTLVSGDDFHLIVSFPLHSNRFNIVTVYYPDSQFWQSPTQRKER